MRDNILNRYAKHLFWVGLTAVAVFNWRQWQQNQALALRLRANPPPLPSLTKTPKVSILVAAWNEAEQIEPFLKSFLALTYPAIELVICAGGPDKTLEKALKYANERIILLEQYPNEGKQHALGRCMEQATGEIIYLTDADCFLETETLLRLLAPLVNEGEAVAAGRVRPHLRQQDKVLPRYLWAADLFANARDLATPYCDGIHGSNAALTRHAIEESGGLDFYAPTGTDYHLARRLIAKGFAIRYVGDSLIFADYPENLPHYWKAQARWLKNLLLYSGQYQAYQQLWTALQSSLIGATMFILPLGTFLVGPLALVLWGILLANAFLAKARYAFFAALLQRRPLYLRHILAIPPLTFVDFAVWATPLWQILRAKSRKQW